MPIPPFVERRRHLRAYIPIAVTIRSAEHAIADDGILQNLSEGGALIACRNSYRCNTSLQLVMHLPGGGDIRLLGKVSRTECEHEGAYLVAVVFEAIPPEGAKHIDEYVRSEAANRNSRAVLIAHESSARLRKVGDQLIVRGYRPLIASTLHQAMELVAREGDAVVLALVGPRLREGTAEALLEALASTHPKLHRARLGPLLDGTKLQRTLDRVAAEPPPAIPWDLDNP